MNSESGSCTSKTKLAKDITKDILLIGLLQEMHPIQRVHEIQDKTAPRGSAMKSCKKKKSGKCTEFEFCSMWLKTLIKVKRCSWVSTDEVSANGTKTSGCKRQ